MTPETQEAVQVTLNVLKAGDGTRRHGELLERVIRDLTAERDRAKGLAEGLAKELRDAVAARGQAERERDEALKERREESAALDRVRKLHKRNENSGVCEPCSMNDYPDYSVTWPCDTIRAADGSGT